MQAQLGQLVLAEQNLRKAISLLRQLYAADPSNVNYLENMVSRQVMLADLLQDSGQPAAAWSLAEELSAEIESGGVSVLREKTSPKEYINFLLVRAKIDLHSDDVEMANSNSGSLDRFDKIRFEKMRYLWWQGNGQEGLEDFSIPAEIQQSPFGKYQSCLESDYEARMHLLDGDLEKAAGLVDYLRNRGYAAPGFMKFCEQNTLCKPVLQGGVG
jgi:tetratricopeptide (TPR) repeat protein